MRPFDCSQCNLSFSSKSNLNRHSRIFHKVELGNKIHGTLKCPSCEERMGTYFSLIDHLNKVHSYQLTCKHVTFKSEADFRDWKSNLERETTAEYVQNSGARKCGVRHVTHFRCHRSGKYRSRSQNKRQLKNIGTNKINEVCTAFIKKIVTELGRGEVRIEVDYCETHCGHSMEPERLHLPLNLKKFLAAKLAAGVPMKQILQETNNNTKSNIDGVVTRKHLHNIAASFCVNVAKPHESDAQRVAVYVQSLCQRESPVLWFKQKGEPCPKHPNVPLGEFVLSTMNDVQQFLLVEHGANGILVDSVPESEVQLHGLYLTTLMVRDAAFAYYPVAFLFSHKKSFDVMLGFFNAIKTRLGDVEVKPSVFSSDDDPVYYMAWKSCFGEVKFNLVCSWHVTRVWERHIMSIEDETARESVKTDLRRMHQELDRTQFEKLLETNCRNWTENESTATFGRYFSANFSCRKQQWAYCYHACAHVNTDTLITNWRSQLEEVGISNGMVTKRLDRCLHSLMTTLNVKHVDKLNVRFKLPARTLETRSRHQNSLEMSLDDVYEVDSGTKWLVPATPNDATAELGFYLVSVNGDCVRDCRFSCSECNVCVHQFLCQCQDRTVRFQLCEHVHLISRYLGKTVSTAEAQEKTTTNVDRSSLQRILDVLTAEVQAQTPSQDSFQAELMKFVSDLKLTVGEAMNCRSVGELQTIRMGLNRTISSLESHRNERSNNEFSILITEDGVASRNQFAIMQKLVTEDKQNDFDDKQNKTPVYYIINV